MQIQHKVMIQDVTVSEMENDIKHKVTKINW